MVAASKWGSKAFPTPPNVAVRLRAPGACVACTLTLIQIPSCSLHICMYVSKAPPAPLTHPLLGAPPVGCAASRACCLCCDCLLQREESFDSVTASRLCKVSTCAGGMPEPSCSVFALLVLWTGECRAEGPTSLAVGHVRSLMHPMHGRKARGMRVGLLGKSLQKQLHA